MRTHFGWSREAHTTMIAIATPPRHRLAKQPLVILHAGGWLRALSRAGYVPLSRTVTCTLPDWSPTCACWS
eukprot:5121356-Prymnesium_polylepis.2